MSLYHEQPSLVLIRSKPGRTPPPPADSQRRGLPPRENRKLRDRGFTKTEIAVLDVLEEINQMIRGRSDRG
jgi:hypothetical protein